MRKWILLSFLLVPFGATHAQTSFDEYQIFLARLGESSRHELKRQANQKNFDEKRLLRLLALSGARVNIPKTEKTIWSDYTLSFSESVELKNSRKFYEDVVTKIDNFEIGNDQSKHYPERALAKIIFQRDLLSHYLKSKKYVEASEARAKLEAMSAEAKKKK